MSSEAFISLELRRTTTVVLLALVAGAAPCAAQNVVSQGLVTNTMRWE